MCQSFSHFRDILHDIVLPKLATNSIQVKTHISQWITYLQFQCLVTLQGPERQYHSSDALVCRDYKIKATSIIIKTLL